MKATANNQQETQRRDFVRVLGKAPRVNDSKKKTLDQLGLFLEAFGPPERKEHKGETLLSWNFINWDRGARNLFCLWCRLPGRAKLHDRLEVEVYMAAGPGIRSFMLWTADRLGAISNGDEAPAVIGPVDFAIARAN